ncbi:MAG TPA: efflux RND transporter permease subunit, partial [Chloroflexota bacterium]|nr:efflux RND transporter permease subunit [Chloroflexota bacterium]
LMTSATLVLALLPVALQLGEGGELRAPLAVVIIGGMVSSTILTLVFVPVSYTYFDGLQRLVTGLNLPRFGRRRTLPDREPRLADELPIRPAPGVPPEREPIGAGSRHRP